MVTFRGLQGIHLAITSLYIVCNTGFAQFSGRNYDFTRSRGHTSVTYSRSGQGSDRFFSRGSDNRYQTDFRGGRLYVDRDRSSGGRQISRDNVQQVQQSYNERNYAPFYPTRDRFTSYRSSERRGFGDPVMMNSNRPFSFSQRGRTTAGGIGRQYTSRDATFGARRDVLRDRWSQLRSVTELRQQRRARRMNRDRTMGYETVNRRSSTSRYSPVRTVQMNPVNPSRQYDSFGEHRPLPLRSSGVSPTYGTLSMGSNVANRYQRLGDRIATRPGFTGERNEAYQQRTSIRRAPTSDRYSSRVYQRRQFSGEPVSSLELPFEPLSARYQVFRDSKRTGQLNRKSGESMPVNERIPRRNVISRTLQSDIRRDRGSRRGRGSLYERGSMQGRGPAQRRAPYSNGISYGRSQQYSTTSRPRQGRFIGDNYIPHLGGSLQAVLGITTLGAVDTVRPVVPVTIQPTSIRNNIPVSTRAQVVVRNRQPILYDGIQNYVVLNSDIGDQMEAKTKLINDIRMNLNLADRLNTLRERQSQNNARTTTLIVPATYVNNAERFNGLTGRTTASTAPSTAILIPGSRNRQGNRRFVEDLEDGSSNDISHSDDTGIDNSLADILENIIEAHRSDENEITTSPSPVNMVIITRPGRNTRRHERYIDTK